MAHSPPIGAAIQRQDTCEHLAKGTGWGFASVVTAIAIAVIAIGIISLATTLMMWDGLFVYNWALVNPLHLLWAIPVTICFIAIDVAIIFWVGNYALKAIKGIGEATRHCGNKMLEHYGAVCGTPANRA